MTATEISLTVNGRSHKRSVEPRMLLADFLRHELRFTGTHVACAHGVCGACTIDFNGTTARSCLLLAIQADGATIITVEGLAGDGPMTAVQHAFREHHALQCGFCTPGFLMLAEAYLAEGEYDELTEEQARELIASNLCRCTGYQGLIEAVLATAHARGARAPGARAPGEPGDTS
jgi:carbon-monoxide dehydrogenase small subunit